jgi:serine/threonine protein kinase
MVTVHTAQDELNGIVLHPVGKQLPAFNSRNVDKKFLEPAEKILKDVHLTGYFHRDVKPQNFIMYQKKKLFLIDFDISAKQGEKSNRGFLGGTTKFSSPLLAKDHTYETKDDMLSLVLSAINLAFPVLFDTFGKQDLLTKIAQGTLVTTAVIQRIAQENVPHSWIKESSSDDSSSDEEERRDPKRRKT